MGVGEGEVLLETHLEALSFIYLGQAKASLIRPTSRREVLVVFLQKTERTLCNC